MPLFLDSAQFGSAALNGGDCITIGLVNNMPDAAVEATERQFVDLIRAAAPEAAVQLKLFAIPQMPRAAAVRQQLAERYRDISALWDIRLDGLIVTGTEPRARNLKDEPYWETLSTLVDWSRAHTASAIWSCLAAHAAVLHADGVERRPFKEKLCGVFDCRPAVDHPMTHAITEPFAVSHSRYNDLPARALKSTGYKILSQSAAAGADIFAKQDGSFFLFFQGHPEYDADSLLREYRRDAARFLAAEREHYPALPSNYFNAEATALAQTFCARAVAERRSELMAEFPKTALAAGLANSGADGLRRRSAISIYEKWIAFLAARKAERRSPGMPLRRTWRDWPLGVRREADSSA
jgi:homoserine O-succinyltransferase/O-acetyltransferase